ncbi:hypothetical protein BDV11DRAFT_198467 [Aspergillus similis]
MFVRAQNMTIMHYVLRSPDYLLPVSSSLFHSYAPGSAHDFVFPPSFLIQPHLYAFLCLSYFSSLFYFSRLHVFRA